MNKGVRKWTKKYQEVLGTRFPSVRVRALDEDYITVVEVFHVPNNRGREFALFVLHELPGILKNRGVPYFPISEYSEDSTRKFFPDL